VTTALAGRYRIERELGQGGMATVYLADAERHGRKVAVKVLRTELASSLGPERFLREIKIAANLSHPHIVPLYDSGEARGLLYYVMPYIEDETSSRPWTGASTPTCSSRTTARSWRRSAGRYGSRRSRRGQRSGWRSSTRRLRG
jgi:serine/threonine protein kinase